MKILHYLHGLPPVRNGGLVQYALDLAQGEYESGNDVQLLVPGRFNRRLKGRTEIRLGKWKNLPCYYVINPLPVTEGRRIEHVELLLKHSSFEIFLSFLKMNTPDIIHMHSFMGIECTFLEAARKLGIPVVLTTHDYYGLCPKVNLFENGKNCDRTDWQRCVACMGAVSPEKKIIWQHSDLYRKLKENKIFHWLEYSPRVLSYKIYVRNMLKKNRSVAKIGHGSGCKETASFECCLEKYEWLRKYYLQMYKNVTCFHFNSRQSRQVFESYLGNVRGKVIPITNRRIKDNRRINKYNGKLKIGYLGNGQRFKGYQYMKEAMDALYESGMTEFECHVYFNSQDLSCPYLHRHEPYKEEEMDTVFRNMDVLVVPSLCRETFGMVALEALSYGVPVVISSYVGARELFEKNQGMGFFIDLDKNSDELRNILEGIYKNRDLLSQMNKKICKWDYEWDFDIHVAKIMNLYSGLY